MFHFSSDKKITMESTDCMEEHITKLNCVVWVLLSMLLT